MWLTNLSNHFAYCITLLYIEYMFFASQLWEFFPIVQLHTLSCYDWMFSWVNLTCLVNVYFTIRWCSYLYAWTRRNWGHLWSTSRYCVYDTVYVHMHTYMYLYHICGNFWGIFHHWKLGNNFGSFIFEVHLYPSCGVGILVNLRATYEN